MFTPKFFRLTEKAFRFQTMFYRFGKIFPAKTGVFVWCCYASFFYICNKLTRYNHEQCGAASDGDGCPMTEELPAKNTLLYMSRT